MLDGMPEVEDLTAIYEHLGALPDPLGSVTDDDHEGLWPHPAQLLELGPQAVEDRIRIA